MYIKKEDESYFDEILKEYPECLEISRIKGFNGVDWVQLIFETSKEFLPIILATLDVFLSYMAVKIQRKDLDLHNKEAGFLEKDLVSKSECHREEPRFEIKIVCGSRMLTYSNDDLEECDPKCILEKIADVLDE